MDTLASFYTAALPAGPDYAARLREELAYLEHRLASLRAESDCAYDRALQRGYEAVIDSRRRQLAQLSPLRPS